MTDTSEEPALAVSFSRLPLDVVGPAAPLGRVPNLIRFMNNPAVAQLRWAKTFRGAEVVSPVRGDARIVVAYGGAALRNLCALQGADGNWIRPEAGGIKLIPGTIPHVAIRGISTTNGAEHASRRNPAMAVTHGRERLALAEKVFAEHAAAVVATLGEHADASAFCSEFASRNAVQVVFGLKDDVLVRARLQDIDDFMAGVTSPFTLILQKDWPLTPYRRWLRVTERLYHWAARVIEEERDPEGRSILGALARSRDEHGNAPSPQRLIGDAVNLYVVGHGSTWQQTAWALLLIAAHPEVQSDLRKQLAAVLGGRAPTSEDALPLLDACLNETLRLLPVTHVLNPRLARRDVQLGSGTIPAGAMVFGAMLHAHHDPELWRDPKRFDPQRWLGGAKPDAYAFLPFGQGQRRCVGDAIAWSQMRVLTAMLLQKTCISLVQGVRYGYRVNPIQLMPDKALPLRLVQELPRTSPRLEGRIKQHLLSE